MPANPILLMAAIQSGLAAAPDVLRFAVTAKSFIEGLFTAKVLSADEQNQLFAFVDERCAARLRGELPKHWQVEPDPV